MAYNLGGAAIKAPDSMKETNLTQYAQQKALSGAVGRDYYGSNKRVWSLSYKNCKKSAYDTIKTVYNTYLSTNTAQTWVSTETNYPITSTTVHIDLLQRGFSVQGSDYISDFDLILVEA